MMNFNYRRPCFVHEEMGLSLQDLYKLMDIGVIKYEIVKPSYKRVISQIEVDKFNDSRAKAYKYLRKHRRDAW